MIVPPTDEKKSKGKSPLQALCGLFVLKPRSDKKSAKSTEDDVVAPMTAEWVKSEAPNKTKVVPTDTLKTSYHQKSFFPSVLERNIYTRKCPCCSNKIKAYFHRRDGALFNKYVDQAGKQAIRIYTEYDKKMWNKMGYQQTLDQGEKYDTWYKKRLTTLYCQKCGKAVSNEYLSIYLQEKTGGFSAWTRWEYVKEKN